MNVIKIDESLVFFDVSCCKIVFESDLYNFCNGLLIQDFERMMPLIVKGRYNLYNTLYWNIKKYPEYICLLYEVLDNIYTNSGYLLNNEDCISILVKLEKDLRDANIYAKF